MISSHFAHGSKTLAVVQRVPPFRGADFAPLTIAAFIPLCSRTDPAHCAASNSGTPCRNADTLEILAALQCARLSDRGNANYSGFAATSHAVPHRFF
jgi:hypothetical protein